MLAGTHQAVFLQHEHTRGFVEGTRGESSAVAAPRHRVHLGGVSRELAAFAVVFEALLHLLVVLRRHLGGVRKRERNVAADGEQRHSVTASHQTNSATSCSGGRK